MLVLCAALFSFAPLINTTMALDLQSEVNTDAKVPIGGAAGTKVPAKEEANQTKYFGVERELFFLCFIGAFVLFFKLQKEDNPTLTILAAIEPAWKDNRLARISDALIFAVLGALIAGVITQPTNPQQAIAAGLGWTGLLSKSK